MATTEPLSPEGHSVGISRKSSMLVHDGSCSSYSALPPSVEALVKRFQEEKLIPGDTSPSGKNLQDGDQPHHTTYPPEGICLSPSASSLWVLPVPGDKPLVSQPSNSPWDPPVPADVVTPVIQYGDIKDCSEAHLLSESESETGDMNNKSGPSEKPRPSCERGDPVGSDCDSDVDLMKTMKQQRNIEQPTSILSSTLMAEDDEENDADEDEDFTVHFAHHGRKSDTMTSRSDLLSQITELQEAVVEMKGTLTEAVTRLGTAGDDLSLGKEITDSRLKCDSNTAEILKLVLSLKTDITSLKKEVCTVSDRQESIQTALSVLLEDRLALGHDLAQSGVISQHTKIRLETPLGGVADSSGVGVQRTGSGSHSNDSGVALLLERAHQAFSNDQAQHHHHKTSDQDSLPEQPSLLVPASVYDYVATLGTPAHSLLSAHSSAHSAPHQHMRDSSQCSQANVRQSGVGGDSEDLGLVYDSDSSLTIAANKTISLSASLSQEMRVTGPKPRSHSHGPGMDGDGNLGLVRTDSDGSDQSRDQPPPSRRRRPVDHAFGGDMYNPIQRSRSHGERDHHHHSGHHRDPRESQRYRVAREMLDTEKKYCKTLWTIQDVFADPLKKANILSHKDITTLFPEEVYQLYDKHCLLQHQLRERLASWKWQPLVGDILSRFTDPRLTDVLRLYTAYVNDFPEVLKTFHKLCRSSPPFTKFIKSCLEQPACGGLDLGAFLLTPVQRVPRYILLLKQLLKYTDPTHPDYRHINACLDRLRDFLARLNDSMEHSFQLVHATLSPSAPAPSGSTIGTSISSGHRPGRSPRRSVSSIGSPAYSPDRLSRRSPNCSPDSEGRRSPEGRRSVTSPLRSKSSAGLVRRPNTLNIDTSRSSSLPRNSPSNGSRSSSTGSQDHNTPRHRSRSESTSRRALGSRGHHHSSSNNNQDQHDSSGTHSLVPARSVTDVPGSLSPSNDIQRWEELAASEPSLIDNRQHNHHSVTDYGMKPHPSSHSIYSVSGSQKFDSPSWTDSSSSQEDQNSKKKNSLRNSIKNMFTFKKRYVGQFGEPHHMIGQHFLTSPALSHSQNLTFAQAYAMASHSHTPSTSSHTHITTHDHMPVTSASSAQSQRTRSHRVQSQSGHSSHNLNHHHTQQECSKFNPSIPTPDHSSIQLNPALAHLNRPTIRVVHISSV